MNRRHQIDVRRAELRALARRSREVVLLAAVTGVITGLLVAGVEYFVVEVLFHDLLDAALGWQMVIPTGGLIVSAFVLRMIGGGASPSTSDEYLAAFHDREHRLGIRAFIARSIAAVTTLSSGGALGLEGPSLYAGAVVGSQTQSRLPGIFRGSDRRVLMVAGAAAGVAAIFKAPATGAIFALEVPYRDDLARRMLLPALVASASGYLSFVAVNGTEPLFRAFGRGDFGLAELLGAALVGAGAAIGARAFAKALRWAKGLAARRSLWILAAAGVTLGALVWLADVLTNEPLTLGPGYQVIAWAEYPSPSFWLIVAILAMRCTATVATVAGGGVGGLFVPLVVAGALLGEAVGGIVAPDDLSLFPVLGIAAFLGAGYRVPLAAVMFVSETTGRPGFIVPGLIAAVVAELVMGEQSITSYQRGPGAP